MPPAWRVRDDWEEPGFQVNLRTDPDRANLAGVTNLDVANASVAGMNGQTVTVLREGRRQIPVVARLRWNERAELADVRNLYVYSSLGEQKVPLRTVSSVGSRDAFLAGFVAARYGGREVEECLRFAVACGAESTQHFGAGVLEQREVERLVPDVRVEQLETPAVTVS